MERRRKKGQKSPENISKMRNKFLRSTFAWWIAYLLPDGAQSFYDTDPIRLPFLQENFLPEWTPLRLFTSDDRREAFIQIDANFSAWLHKIKY